MQDPKPTPAPMGAAPRAWRMLLSGDVRAYRWFFALCTVVTVAPLWSADVFPFQDYAGNMSYAAILAGAWQEGSLLHQTYEVGGLLLPNGLLFWSWALLGKAIGFITAGKILLTLYAIALPLSVDRLLVSAGRERRFALLTFPLVYNYNLMMGFASYVTAIPIALYALTWAYRLLDAPSNRRIAIVAGLSALTFIGHAQAYLVLGVMALAFVCFVPRTRREFVMVCGAFAASLLVFMPWFVDEFLFPPESTALGGSALIPAFQDPVELFARWAEYSFVKWENAYDGWVFLAVLGVFVAGLFDRRVDSWPGEGRARFGFEAMTVAVLVAYLCTPEHTTVQAAIGSRLVVFVMLLAVGWLQMPRFRHAPVILLVTMTIIVVNFGVNVRADIRRFQSEEVGANFLSMIDALPEESRLAVIIHDRRSPTVEVHAHEHMYGYHFALNRGIAYSGFHSFYGRHARWLPGKEVPYPGRQVRSFMRGANACQFDYLLTRTKGVPRWKKLEDRLTYLDHSLGYSLWRIESDRIPLCNPSGDETPAQAMVAGARNKIAKLKSSTVASTLAPKVGRARGRTLEGEWKRRTPVPARKPARATSKPDEEAPTSPPAPPVKTTVPDTEP